MANRKVLNRNKLGGVPSRQELFRSGRVLSA
jgi:hypothetical protein